MIEAIGRDVFSFPSVVITTNGIVKGNRKAVMGRGIALQAVEKFHGIDTSLGIQILHHGNVSAWLGQWNGQNVYSMPTKNHWRDPSPISLIVQSAVKLVDVVNALGFNEEIGMPPPGCGNGGLDWKVVGPILKDILDDRFVVCIRGEQASYLERLQKLRT